MSKADENQAITQLISILDDEALNTITGGMDLDSAKKAGPRLAEKLLEDGWKIEKNFDKDMIVQSFTHAFSGLIPPDPSEKPETR